MTYPGYRQPGFPAGGPYNSHFQSMGVPFLTYNHMPYKQESVKAISRQVQPQQTKRMNAFDRELARIMTRPQKEQKQMIGEKIFAAIEKKMGKIKEAGG